MDVVLALGLSLRLGIKVLSGCACVILRWWDGYECWSYGGGCCGSAGYG